MSEWIMNARMYAVTAGVEAAWRELLERITNEAGVEFSYLRYPAPQPLEQLWSRPDLGSVFMCGFPIALKLAAVIPLAAPIPRAAWAGGRALYRSDLIVRRDAPYVTLEDTFGARAGWTVAHSQSGFNAFRHHLLGYRTPERPALYSEMAANLVTARNVLDSVRERRIDVGPLDAYWHMLIARHAPQLTADIRVLTSTAVAPMPALVAAAGAPAPLIERLRAAFSRAATRPWFGPLGDFLLLDGFAEVSEQSYATLLEWDQAATAAGFERPA
ncbi:MAG TPA: PhnD/SsuA/transferrin family substrate-binding protein [Steroidobacteraceae bacterium]|jgi:ABC-type phosphate/phosphonate transport system substrate-binding protein|nr:PhnD/SsuA/transferrin family substrate-binding protein [Steroidobacteraceae bacterium]